ncbi:MAG: glycoside hydrolase family 2 TIM barrel-domain containing protein [Planctomycetota bacterium]
MPKLYPISVMMSVLFGLALSINLASAQEVGLDASDQTLQAKHQGVIPVTLRQSDTGWELLRDGKPYYIKGGGVKPGLLAEFVAAGGNSIRTWGAKDQEALLDEAHENGLTVMLGIWLGHPKHGFDYGDEDAKNRQVEEALAYVRRYKDHPAVLLWGVGNEVEIQTPQDERIYKQINRVAREIKAIDPHHPTVMVTAGSASMRLHLMDRLCPDIDILGPNLYGESIDRVVEQLESLKIDRPFIVPEYGPPGQWGRDDNTPWGAPFEPSSTDKARFYLRHYASPINSRSGQCLGGYVFYWKYDKFNRAWPSWYSMHHHTGEAYEGIDVMRWAWTGRFPENQAPQIVLLDSPVKGEIVDVGYASTARVTALDRDNDPLSYEWVLSPDHEAKQTFAAVSAEQWITSGGGAELEFRVPDDAQGPYRLHVVVRDGRGKAARANVPFYVALPRVDASTHLISSESTR